MSKAAAVKAEKPVQTAGVEWQPSAGTRHWLVFQRRRSPLLGGGTGMKEVQKEQMRLSRNRRVSLRSDAEPTRIPLPGALADRVEARKRIAQSPPWTLELRGTQHTLLVDDVTLAALAAGLVTARLQCQAAMCARYIQEPEE